MVNPWSWDERIVTGEKPMKRRDRMDTDAHESQHENGSSTVIDPNGVDGATGIDPDGHTGAGRNNDPEDDGA